VVEKDKRSHLLGERRYKQLKTHRGIRVGAARDSESATDKRRKDGQYYGLFTWYWAQNLQKARAGETWSDVFKRTYTQVTLEHSFGKRNRYTQQPQIEGDRSQQVLGGGFTPLPPRLPIVPIYDKWVQIKAGSLTGVTKDGVPEPAGAFQNGDLVV
jgi:hypothetical protein